MAKAFKCDKCKNLIEGKPKIRYFGEVRESL